MGTIFAQNHIMIIAKNLGSVAARLTVHLYYRIIKWLKFIQF